MIEAAVEELSLIVGTRPACRALAGLPQMIGTRGAEKVAASRGKGSWSREGSCYYGEPEARRLSLPSRRPRSR
jgi:hypothetical protein